MLLMRSEDDHEPDALPSADWQALFSQFVSWSDALQRRGHLIQIDRLLDPSGGRTVRKRRDAVTVDGPYAEGKEAVVGLCVIEAHDLDEAVRIAGEVPWLDFGGAVEVRAIGDFPRVGEPAG